MCACVRMVSSLSFNLCIYMYTGLCFSFYSSLPVTWLDTSLFSLFLSDSRRARPNNCVIMTVCFKASKNTVTIPSLPRCGGS